MTDLLVLDAANTTTRVRAVQLDTATAVIMMSTPGTIGGTTLVGQGTIASSIAVNLPSNQIVSTLITNSFITSVLSTAYFTTGAPTSSNTALLVALSPNGLNPNGGTAAANSAPTVIAINQTAIAVLGDTSGLSNGISTPVLTQNFTAFSMNTNSTSSLVAAVASKKIRVINFWATTSTATNFQLLSAAATVSGLMQLTDKAGIVLPEANLGWLETAAGSALVGSSSASATVSGNITYITI